MAADPSFVVGIIGQFAAHRRHQGIAFWLSLFISSNRIDRRVLSSVGTNQQFRSTLAPDGLVSSCASSQGT